MPGRNPSGDFFSHRTFEYFFVRFLASTAGVCVCIYLIPIERSLLQSLLPFWHAMLCMLKGSEDELIQ
jgi:hypothetical protein